MEPLFSIIIPVYNAETYLDDCILSALNQTFPFFEIVACNDGSDDISLAILKEYEKKDERVRVLDQKNAGVTAARQACLNASRGSYIVCMDADDTLEENCLEEYAKAVDLYDADIVCAGYNRVSRKKSVQNPVAMPYGVYNRKQIEKEIFPIMFEPMWGEEIKMTFWGKAIRKELFEAEHRLLPTYVTLGEDNAVMVPCFYRANTVVILPQCLYNYRKSLTSVINNGKARDFDMLKERVLFYQQRVDLNTHFLRNSFYRSITHSLFNFCWTQFYRKEKQSVIEQDIIAHINDPIYKEILDNCVFPAKSKGAMALEAIKELQFKKMKVYSRLKKGKM